MRCRGSESADSEPACKGSPDVQHIAAQVSRPKERIPVVFNVPVPEYVILKVGFDTTQYPPLHEREIDLKPGRYECFLPLYSRT